MTVKKVTDAQKEMIKANFEKNRMSIRTMAKNLEVSERTIARVLSEFGLKSDRGKANQVFVMLKKYEVDIPTLHKLLVFYKHGPSRAQVVKYMSEISDDECASIQNEYITARVANKFNTKIQSAMLSISNKVNTNAKTN